MHEWQSGVKRFSLIIGAVKYFCFCFFLIIFFFCRNHTVSSNHVNQLQMGKNALRLVSSARMKIWYATINLNESGDVIFCFISQSDQHSADYDVSE